MRTLLTFAILAAGPICGQNRPDIIGLYPGMPAEQARARLQSQSDAARIQNIATVGFSLDIARPQEGTDQIKVYFTRPPNPPVVWAIAREAGYEPGNMITKSTLLATLRRKYGPETAMLANGAANASVWWLFDQSGNHVPSADPRMLSLCQSTFQQHAETLMTIGLGSPIPASQPCFESYYAVWVNIAQNYGSDMVPNFSAALVNLPMGYRAAMNVMRAKNAAADAAEQKEHERARQKKPVF